MLAVYRSNGVKKIVPSLTARLKNIILNNSLTFLNRRGIARAARFGHRSNAMQCPRRRADFCRHCEERQRRSNPAFTAPAARWIALRRSGARSRDPLARNDRFEAQANCRFVRQERSAESVKS
jgi:hypothetical protein